MSIIGENGENRDKAGAVVDIFVSGTDEKTRQVIASSGQDWALHSVML